MRDIPAHPHELTPAWLTHAMHQAGSLQHDVAVASVSTEPLQAGTGLSGQTVRLRLAYDRPSTSAPATAVAKFAAEHTTMKALLEAADIYAREIAFYRDLADRVPIRAPKFLAGDYDPLPQRDARGAMLRVFNRMPAKLQVAATADTEKKLKASERRYALVIEDLGTDYTVHPIDEPPSPGQLADVLTLLAQQHAAFWGDASVHGHESLGSFATTPPRLMRNCFLGRDRGLALDRWSWLSGEALATLDAATHTLEADLELLDQPVTLLHGDTRSDNALFGADGSVVYVDWAMPMLGHPGGEIGYLLGSSLRVEDAAHAPALVEHYRQELAALGRHRPFDDFWEAARASWRFQVVAIVNGLQFTIMPGLDDGTRTEDHWVPRMLELLSVQP